MVPTRELPRSGVAIATLTDVIAMGPSTEALSPAHRQKPLTDRNRSPAERVAPRHCSFAPTLITIRKDCALLAQRLSALPILLSAAPSTNVLYLSSSSFDPEPKTSSGRLAGGPSTPALAAERVAPKHCSFAPTLRTIRKDCRRVNFGLETLG